MVGPLNLVMKKKNLKPCLVIIMKIVSSKHTVHSEHVDSSVTSPTLIRTRGDKYTDKSNCTYNWQT